MISAIVTQRFHDKAQSLYQRTRNVRELRDGLRLQSVLKEAIEQETFTVGLFNTACLIPAMEAMLEVPAGVLPSYSTESLRSVQINPGMTDRTVQTAAVSDWLNNTADALRSFTQTADYHYAGLQARCTEVLDKLRAGQLHVPGDKLIFAKPLATRQEEYQVLADLMADFGPMAADPTDQSPQAYEAFNTVLMAMAGRLSRICGMSQNKDDFGDIGDTGMFCSEIIGEGTLDSLGYTPARLETLLELAIYVIRTAREIVRKDGSYVESVRDATVCYTAVSQADHTDSLEDSTTALNAVPSEDDRALPQDDATGAEQSTNNKTDAQSVEVFSLSITCLANYVTVLTCLLDCTAHLGLELVSICDALEGI